MTWHCAHARPRLKAQLSNSEMPSGHVIAVSEAFLTLYLPTGLSETRFTGGNSDSRPIVPHITKIDIFYCMNMHKRRLSTIGGVCERG